MILTKKSIYDIVKTLRSVMTIDEFIKKLSEYQGNDVVTNIYSGKEGAKRRKALKDYLLVHQNAQILLVGEAPGHNGCAKTGIPFTTTTNEPSAKAIQEIIGSRKDIIMWNAFPFHPHKKEDLNSNRTPTSAELSIGYIHLNNLLLTFPKLICFAAIGRTAEKQLTTKLFPYPSPVYIRHPAHGGKTLCQKQLKDTLAKFDQFIKDSQPYKNWPNYITEEKHSTYLDKIKLEYIVSAECERLDPYYEYASSKWWIALKLNVHGYMCRTGTIFNKKLYNKFIDMIEKSGEFDCKSEIPMQYGHIVYARKAK